MSCLLIIGSSRTQLGRRKSLDQSFAYVLIRSSTASLSIEVGFHEVLGLQGPPDHDHRRLP